MKRYFLTGLVLAVFLIEGFVINSQRRQIKGMSKKLTKIETKIEQLASQRQAQELSAIRILVLNSIPNLYELSELERVKLINEWVYKSVTFKNSPPPTYLKGSAFLGFFYSSNNSHYGHICGGVAWILIHALESVGIPARYVGVFSNIDQNNSDHANHASVDAYVNGRFIAIDPTFNVQFTDQSGSYLSWFELAELNRQKEKYKVIEGSIAKGRSLSTYYYPLEKMLNYLAMQPIRLGNKEFAMEFFPTSWDGKLKVNDHYSNISETLNYYYKQTGQGFLRN